MMCHSLGVRDGGFTGDPASLANGFTPSESDTHQTCLLKSKLPEENKTEEKLTFSGFC